ncbi:hypothetical protein [Curtobacterium sp. MCJR17_043]|uniref:aldose epimerase family protein n=1 Tax=Curtobacterium sp. MCJR17_043 TaxID=2175660 RepID=UPI0032E905C0
MWCSPRPCSRRRGTRTGSRSAWSTASTPTACTPPSPARTPATTGHRGGTGPHPYLLAGAGTVDDWTLTLPAAEVLEVTEDRLIPTDLVPVHDEFDLRTPTHIGPRFIDHAFTGFDRDTDGIAAITVTAADGHGVRVAFGPECGWAQVHTADHVVPGYHRAGLAVEPMTCAPNAFNGDAFAADVDAGLVVLEPGTAHAAAWTISAV